MSRTLRGGMWQQRPGLDTADDEGGDLIDLDNPCGDDNVAHLE